MSEDTTSGADEPSLVPMLASISKSTRAFIGLHLATVDLVVGQEQLLFALARRQGRHLTDVADELLVRPSTISKMIDQLERDGICLRTRSDNDQRKTVLTLTPKGEKLAAAARRIANDIDQELARAADPENLAALEADLAQTSRALIARLSRLR